MQDASTRTQDARRVAAGAVDAERPQRRRRMPAEWTQNARRHSAKLFLGSTVQYANKSGVSWDMSVTKIVRIS